MRADIGFRRSDMVAATLQRPRRTSLTPFQIAVLQFFEENGDGYGAVIGGHYYVESQVRYDASLAEHLYWTIGG